MVAFDVPKTTWRADEAITARAQLRFEGTDSTTIWTSGGGPIGFRVVEVNGKRNIAPSWLLDCVNASLPAAVPITTGLVKTGSNVTAFERQFFRDPLYRLPAGDWDLTAEAMFTTSGCGNGGVELRATVRLHITPAPTGSG